MSASLNVARRRAQPGNSALLPAQTWGDRVLTICPTIALGAVGILALLMIARLGAIAALVFLICTVVLVLRNPGRTLIEARRNVLLWLVAGWSLLSVLWSAHPDLTLRFGIQLCITMAFGIALASRLAPITFVRLMAWTYGLIGVAGLLFGRVRGDGMGWLGMFDSKNIFAGASGFMVIACMAITLDPRQPRQHRLFAAAGMALGMFLVLQGQSVGVTLAMMVALTGMVILVALHRVRRVARVVLSVMSGLLLVLVLLTILSYSSEFAALMLDVTGKDVTLTGRTYLWEAAFAEIARTPWLGQGFQAVWVVGNPVAEEMWLEFGIESKSGFHFHNTFISNTVEIGIIGIVLQTLSFGSALVYILIRALLDPRAETILLAGIMLRQLVLSMSEVVFFFQFDATTVLTVVAVVYAGRMWREAPLGAAVPPEDGAALPAIRDGDGRMAPAGPSERRR